MKFGDWVYISKFFPVYAPAVKNWKHKNRGVDGHGKPIEYTDEDRIAIKLGLEKLFKDLTGWILDQPTSKNVYHKWMVNLSRLRIENKDGNVVLDVFTQKELLDDLK